MPVRESTAPTATATPPSSPTLPTPTWPSSEYADPPTPIASSGKSLGLRRSIRVDGRAIRIPRTFAVATAQPQEDQTEHAGAHGETGLECVISIPLAVRGAVENGCAVDQPGGIAMSQEAMEVVLDHIHARRRRDRDAVEATLDPAVMHEGVRPELICHNRDEVLTSAGWPAPTGYRRRRTA
jgi:hypothetical protein